MSFLGLFEATTPSMAFEARTPRNGERRLSELEDIRQSHKPDRTACGGLTCCR